MSTKIKLKIYHIHETRGFFFTLNYATNNIIYNVYNVKNGYPIYFKHNLRSVFFKGFR